MAVDAGDGGVTCGRIEDTLAEGFSRVREEKRAASLAAVLDIEWSIMLYLGARCQVRCEMGAREVDD